MLPSAHVLPHRQGAAARCWHQRVCAHDGPVRSETVSIADLLDAKSHSPSSTALAIVRQRQAAGSKSLDVLMQMQVQVQVAIRTQADT